MQAVKTLVIIVTYNGEKWLHKCLESIPADADVMVVDNASTDSCVEIAANSDHPVILIQSKQNLGFGAANNIGLQYAIDNGYDYVYLLNQDAYLEPNTIAKLIEAHKNAPEYGILSPMQYNANGSLDTNFSRKTGFSDASAAQKSNHSVTEVPFVMAAHWLMPVEAVRRIGGFSPTFPHYGEDDNLVDRAQYHGFKVGVVAGTSAIHDRAERKLTKDQHCTRKCLIPVIRMSNPCCPWSLAKAIFWLTGCSVKNMSLIPLKYCKTLKARKKEITANTEASRREGAFLK